MHTGRIASAPARCARSDSAGGNSNATDIKQRAAFKIIGRSTAERQNAFAMDRPVLDLNRIQTDFLVCEFRVHFPPYYSHAADDDMR